MPRALKLGMEGEDVTMLQQLLTERGFPVAPVGVFGPKTFAAVCEFQERHLDQDGRALTVDGQVGPGTWWSLTSTPADRRPPAATRGYAPTSALEQRITTRR
jgi:peptidoglycan hydrolase-like protein with peptidoglycan-binding domain